MFQMGTYLHELGHVLGLVHEHQLPIRDQYVTINWPNVNADMATQFDKYTNVRTYDNSYDLSSIMHYEHNVSDEKISTEIRNFSLIYRSGMEAYAGAARRRVHLATVLFRPTSGHRPGRPQADTKQTPGRH